MTSAAGAFGLVVAFVLAASATACGSPPAARVTASVRARSPSAKGGAPDVAAPDGLPSLDALAARGPTDAPLMREALRVAAASPRSTDVRADRDQCLRAVFASNVPVRASFADDSGARARRGLDRSLRHRPAARPRVREEGRGAPPRRRARRARSSAERARRHLRSALSEQSLAQPPGRARRRALSEQRRRSASWTGAKTRPERATPPLSAACPQPPRPMLRGDGRETCVLVGSKKRHGASAISPA